MTRKQWKVVESDVYKELIGEKSRNTTQWSRWYLRHSHVVREKCTCLNKSKCLQFSGITEAASFMAAIVVDSS